LIDDGMRQGLLDQFPGSVPLTVVVAGTDFYKHALTRRPGLTLLPLVDDVALPANADPNVIVDGLDALDEPLTALRALRRPGTVARMYALVSNGAYGVTLLKFLACDAHAAAHPLVAADLPDLFAESGWCLVDRIAMVDQSVAHGPIPYAVTERDVSLKVTTPEIAERLSTAGFLVIADPQ
jgi:hypothetical protein